MADTDEKEAKSSGGGGVLQIVNLILLLLVLAVGGFIAWKMLQMDHTAVPEQVQGTEMAIPQAEADDSSSPPIYMELEDITVNLADVENEKFLRTKIKLEVRNEDAEAKVEANMVKVMDLIITQLSSKKFAEIRTPQGKYTLKEDLTFRLNELLGGGKPIKNLYFTDFVSQ